MKNKKNICFVSGDITRSGGTERVGTMVANELAKYKDKYNIYILSVSKVRKEPFFNIYKNIKQYHIYEQKVDFKKQYIRTVREIRKFIKNNDIDILIDIDIILDMFSIPATIFTKTKLISWEHFNYYENLGVKLRDVGRRLAARYSDYIITITEEDKSYFKENLKLKCPIDNIYNPLDSIYKDNEYDVESKIILSAGRLTHQKGFDILIDVAQKVLENHKDWKWIILGEGEDRKILECKIKEYGLENNVILEGNVSNIEDYYKKSAMFVLTSRYEGLGLVLTEAKSYKLPLISFECKVGPKEIINNNNNGYLIDCNKVDEMAEKIIELINNNQLRHEFSRKSSIGIEKFEIKSIINKWRSVLDNL